MKQKTGLAQGVTTSLLGLCVIAAWAESSEDSRAVLGSWNFDGNWVNQAAADPELGLLSPRDGAPRFVDANSVPGVSGQALALGVEPGDAPYLAAAPCTAFDLGADYTIELWIQPTTLAQWNRLVLRWGEGPSAYAYHLALREGRASLCHNQSDGRYVFAEGGRLVVGRWYHLVGVARTDAGTGTGTLAVYLNGREVGRAPFDGTAMPAAAEDLGIGDSGSQFAPGLRFQGYIDELTLWNRPLSAAEIAARYARRAAMLRELDQRRIREEAARRAEAFAQVRQRGVDEIVFAERAPGRDPGGHYYANFGYACTDPDLWLYGQDGGSLCKLDLRTGEVRRLVDDPSGAVRDPHVDYDAQTILFSYRQGGGHHYHLFEIGVDGSGLRRITDGPWDDIEPVYLPDGDIIFCSSRARRYIGCWLAPSATLHRCDRDGGNLRMLSSGAFTENTPAVLPDGRVLYTRWEYVNRDPVSFHHLWTMYPDGTAPTVYFGNMHPGGVFIGAKPTPSGDRILLIHSPHHGLNEHAGFVATLTAKHGPDAGEAMRHVSQSANFRDPHPLADNMWLVARGHELLVMDDHGTTELLYASDVEVHEPAAIRTRPRPAIAPPRADLTRRNGTVILADIYAGRNMDGVRRGKIKRLLILEDLPKPVNFHGGGSQPIGHGVTSTLKRILGTVPVEPDGSAHFEVPAMRSIYFAALDEHDRSIKQMRSFLTVQPGETVGCVGCHEPRNQVPAGAVAARAALTRKASPIEPIPDVPAIPDFPRDVQPILDRHCVRCHNHTQRDGDVVLVGDHGPVYSLSYYALLLHWQIKDTTGDPSDGSGRQLGNDPPFTTYSSASPLMNKIDGSHHDVRLSPREQRMIRLWIDAGAQYPGTYAALGTGQVGGCWNNNEPVRVMADDWPSTPPAQAVVERRCAPCHGRHLPRHVTDQVPSLSFQDMLAWERPLSRFSRHRIFNLGSPDQSLVLLAPLAREAGGYAEGHAEPHSVVEDRDRPPRPIVHPIVFADTGDRDYQTVLSHLEAARDKLAEIKRFDMPGFRPNEHYIREMRRYGVLPASLDPAGDPLDVYAIDEAYWRLFWHRPDPIVAEILNHECHE